MSIFQHLSKIHRRPVDQIRNRMKVTAGFNSPNLRQMFFRMLASGLTRRPHTLYEKRSSPLQSATCKDLMRRPGCFLELDFAFDEVIDQFKVANGPVLPVLTNVSELVGLVRLTDLILLMERQGHLRLIAPVNDLMRRPDVFFRSNTPATRACDAMIEKGLEYAPVVDNRVFKGFLTRHELFEAAIIDNLSNTKYISEWRSNLD
ncbi:CBS domain-containing protein (plasmid) [Roseibium aggregatum]|nr:CBS domain-containing protein [Roseibium aggregatum]